MRQFAVLGLGDYGYYAAITLAERGMDVLVVDVDEAAIDHVKDKVAQAVVADVTLKENLESLGLGNVDCALVNLGHRLDSSILTTMHLQEMGVKEIIVKAISEDHVKVLNKVGATRVVYPERDAAITITRRLTDPSILDFIPLSDGYSIVSIQPSSSYFGKTLLEANLRSAYNLNVIAVQVAKQPGSKERKMLFPIPSYVLHPEDQLLVLGKEEDIQKFRDA